MQYPDQQLSDSSAFIIRYRAAPMPHRPSHVARGPPHKGQDAPTCRGVTAERQSGERKQGGRRYAAVHHPGDPGTCSCSRALRSSRVLTCAAGTRRRAHPAWSPRCSPGHLWSSDKEYAPKEHALCRPPAAPTHLHHLVDLGPRRAAAATCRRPHRRVHQRVQDHVVPAQNLGPRGTMTCM